MPCRLMFQRQDAPSAGTFSGANWRRQPNTTSGSIWPSTWRMATGAGRWALRMQTSGADTVNRSSEPELFGMPGISADISANVL
ncbi:hypothetical protein D3C80_2027410 [compost metagenome]